jgi:hypothetical protein
MADVSGFAMVGVRGREGDTQVSWIDLFAIGIAVELTGTWVALAILSVNRDEEPRVGREREEVSDRQT